MPLRPQVFRFVCPACKSLLEVTHLRWSKIECLYCKEVIKNSEVKLIDDEKI